MSTEPAATAPLIARLFLRLEPHKRPLLLLAFFLIFGVSAGAIRLEPREDVLSLIGGVAGDSHQEAAEILSRFGTLDVLLIDLHKAGASRDELEAAADHLAITLSRTQSFERILFRVDAEGMRRAFEILFEKRFFLLAAPAELGPAMEANRRDLLTPAGALLEGITARDPLDARGQLLDRLNALRPKLRLDTSGQTLLSADGHHALLVADPKVKSLDTRAAAVLLASIEARRPEGFELQILGAHVFSAAAAKSIRRDVWATSLFGLFTVLLLFLLYLRQLRAVLIVALPVAVGGLIAAGLIGWSGFSVHGITFGFGAVMLGIGVDYGAHVLMHYQARRRERPEDPPRSVVAHVLGELFGTVGMGALTTLLSFLVLLLSGIRALTELVVYAGLGIAACFLLSMLVLPFLLVNLVPAPLRAPARAIRRGHGVRWPRLTLFVGAVFCVFCAFGLPQLSFDGNVRNLDYQPPNVRALEATFLERYDSPRHPVLIVASASTTEGALKKSDRIFGVLEGAIARREIRSFSSPSALLPSNTRQKANFESYSPPVLREKIERAAETTELDPAAFAPFFADLARAATGSIAPLSAADLAATPLAPMFSRNLIEHVGRTEVLSIAHLYPQADGRPRAPPALGDALSAAGATVVSAEAIASRTVLAIKDGIMRLALVSLALVTLLLALYYRRLRPTLEVLLPTAIAMLVSFGVMGWLNLPLNIVSIGALVLVSGVTVDYGIFLVDAKERGHLSAGGAPSRDSVTIAAVTTILGFGSLLWAKSPVMWSLGFAVTIGVAAGLLASIVLLPATWAVFGDGASAKRRGFRPGEGWCFAQLTALFLSLLALALFWITGARQTHGAAVLLTALLHLAYATWLIVRQTRGPTGG